MFDTRTAQQIEKLFDQQMWAFGRDVLRPEGNLLVLRGLTRCRAPEGSAVSSTWVEPHDWGTVALCSTGVRISCADGELELQRGPMQKQLVGVGEARFRKLAAWMAEYEAWVERVAGIEWRRGVLAVRQKAAKFSAEEMRVAWLGFGGALQMGPAV
jgi:hypothetical protein